MFWMGNKKNTVLLRTLYNSVYIRIGKFLQQAQSIVQSQQQQAAVLPQPGIALPTSLASSPNVGTVSYPSLKAQQPSQGQQATGQKQRVFTGTVTKLHDNFGFIDEDVFFQTT